MNLKVILISDFTIGNLAGYLRNDTSLSADVTIAPFAQVIQTILNDQLDCWQTAHDVAVVWTRPEATLSKFESLLRFEDVALDEILNEVDAYCAALRKLHNRARSALRR